MEVIFHLTDSKARELISYFYENQLFKEKKKNNKGRNLRPGKLRELFCLMHFILLQDTVMSSISWENRALQRMLTSHFSITNFHNAETLDQGSPK